MFCQCQVKKWKATCSNCKQLSLILVISYYSTIFGLRKASTTCYSTGWQTDLLPINPIDSWWMVPASLDMFKYDLCHPWPTEEGIALHCLLPRVLQHLTEAGDHGELKKSSALRGLISKFTEEDDEQDPSAGKDWVEFVTGLNLGSEADVSHAELNRKRKKLCFSSILAPTFKPQAVLVEALSRPLSKAMCVLLQRTKNISNLHHLVHLQDDQGHDQRKELSTRPASCLHTSQSWPLKQLIVNFIRLSKHKRGIPYHKYEQACLNTKLPRCNCWGIVAITWKLVSWIYGQNVKCSFLYLIMFQAPAFVTIWRYDMRFWFRTT